MKAHPTTHYPVHVIPPWGDADRADDPTFDGVFEVQLNHDVRVLFVADLQKSADVLPGERIIVTADASANALSLNESGTTFVRVEPATFTQFLGQLAELSQGPAGMRGGTPVDSIVSAPVIQFLRSSVAIPPHLRPHEQRLLGIAQDT